MLVAIQVHRIFQRPRQECSSQSSVYQYFSYKEVLCRKSLLLFFNVMKTDYFFTIHSWMPYRTAGLTSFPDYLVLHMRKFVMEEGWVPKKLGI